MSTGLPTSATFAVAGASGISAWLFIHPADVVKVKMQLGAPNAVKAAREIVREHGASGLYSGLSAAVTRQAVYTTLRLGLYDWIRENVVVKSGVKPSDVNLFHRAGVGLAAGAIASFCSCPIEVCLVRMQEKKGRYRNVFDALYQIQRSEGLLTYWRGATPTVARAMVVCMTQLGTYDQAKSTLVPIMGDNVGTHLASAVTAAVVYSFASLPLDMAKTRMQTQVTPAGEKPKYTSMLQTMRYVVRKNGFASLWKGFGPYFARSGGHSVLMFMFKEQYTRLAKAQYGVPA